ncbi:MAG: hypothetical protein J5I47_10935 [Vicingus serpentipes]|nr:hypothetical protein [Vicingus serpentipes]
MNLIKTTFALLAITIAFQLNAQEEKVDAPAKQLSNHVNPFTGDFSYNIPLITVSGPNGESFPLNLGYAGGISVNQQATWVGLGWNLNIGEITRQVKGIPDDHNNVELKSQLLVPISNQWTTASLSNVYGPMYFGGLYPFKEGRYSKMDLYATKRGLKSEDTPFIFPDYDDYYVSGPSISGLMRPFLFDFAEYYPYSGSDSYRDIKFFYEKPMFRFVNEPMANIAIDEDLTNFMRVTDNLKLTSYLEPSSGNYNIGRTWKIKDKKVQAPYHYNIGFDAGNFIQFFTNSDIYRMQETVYYPHEKFLDYKAHYFASSTSERLDPDKYDPDGIEAFNITTPNGMMYHYSLPVYTYDDEIVVFETENMDYTSIKKVSKHTKNKKYAYTWKLTAITGPYYEDTNENNIPDDGDKGYWIRINYSKWTEKFDWRFPYYNFYPDFTSENNTSFIEGVEEYAPSGSITKGSSQVYYPESIQTATQTAYFIKGIRNDDHSVANDSSVYTPKLYLKYIVLMDNDDVENNNIFSSPQDAESTAFTEDLETVANVTDILTVEDYAYYQTAIENNALKIIDFDYDYHLAKKMPNNINNTFNETPTNFTYSGGSYEVYKDGSYSSTSGSLDMSGKLTLNKVTMFDLNHHQTQDPYLFEYNTENPDYTHEKQDIFGFYQANHNSTLRDQYITSADDDQVDAWSLSEITTPSGGEINVEYESDTYNGVVYDNVKYNFPLAPTRIFKSSEEDNIDLYSANGNAISTNTFSAYGDQYKELILKEVYGGGTRVKEISLTDPHSAAEYKLTYSYEQGIATVEPDRYQRSNGYTLIKSTHAGDRHAPAPTVGYSKVKVFIGDEQSNIGSIEHNYKNYLNLYRPHVSKEEVTKIVNGKIIDYELGVTKMFSKSGFGQPKNIINYDDNGAIVSKTDYEYSDETSGPIGTVQEVFYKYDDFQTGINKWKVFKNIFSRTNIITHLKKETRVMNGITTIITYDGRDNFTGQPRLITSQTSGYNKNILAKSFAYESNSSMGAKTDDWSNLNILTPIQQETESNGSGKKYDWDNDLLVRAWDDVNDKYATSIESGVFSPVNLLINNGGTWKLLTSSTLYGGKNGDKRLEKKDTKDGYSAIKFGYDERYKIAEVSNCNYTSFAYSGFESTKEVETSLFHFDGEVEKGSGVQKTTVGTVVPHTGDYMVEVPTSSEGPIFKAIVDNTTVEDETFEQGIQVGRTYMASVWVHKDSPDDAQLVFKLDGNVTDNKTIRRDSPNGLQIGDWIQLNLTFDVPSNYVSSGGSNDNDFRVYVENPGSGGVAYFDDLVVHPVDAQFTGYVYDERLGIVKATISNDNFYTRYEYDNAGNIIATYKETQNGDRVVSKVQYNFK